MSILRRPASQSLGFVIEKVSMFIYTIFHMDWESESRTAIERCDAADEYDDEAKTV